MNIENGFEGRSEKFPTRENILEIIKKIENLPFEITRELSDDSGVYFIEIITTEPDLDGCIREYIYSRKSLKTCEELEPKIHVAFYRGGEVVGGEEICSF